LNPTTLGSLVPTVYPDSFNTRDVVTDLVTPVLATGVSESSVPVALARVAVDISSLAAGQPAEILFRLIAGTDPSSLSTVTLSDVDVITTALGPSVVPEPSTCFLAGLGILGWLGYALRPRGWA
jgi:hypothetical protein